MGDDIRVSREDHVALVEFSRPPLNYFDAALIGDLATALRTLDEDRDVRAVVLASSGKNFCAGADFTSGGNFEGGDLAGPLTQLYEAGIELMRTRKPIVAAVQGAAVGGGCGLALVADFRVAGPGSRFTVNFARLGIHPGFGLTITLPRLVGEQKAAELFYTGRRIGGEEALAIGLVDRLVPDGELRAAALAFAREIAASAPLAVMSVRETLRLGRYEAIKERLERELAEQLWLRRTEDAEEGIRAVSERRDGRFVAG